METYINAQKFWEKESKTASKYRNQTFLVLYAVRLDFFIYLYIFCPRLLILSTAVLVAKETSNKKTESFKT